MSILNPPELIPGVSLPERRTSSGLYVREATVGEMHGRDRNKPCPCKSGRKWKACHGRNR